jgi:hypothetical protein
VVVKCCQGLAAQDWGALAMLDISDTNGSYDLLFLEPSVLIQTTAPMMKRYHSIVARSREKEGRFVAAHSKCY